MLQSIILSLQVASIATILVAIVGLAIAYFLTTKKFPGKELVEVFFTLPLVLPPTVVGYYLIILFGRNGFLGKLIYNYTGWTIMFTWYAAILASFVVSLPLMIKASQAAIESVDKTMIDSSYMLGHSQFDTYLKVVFPLAKKGIIAGIVLSFARAIGEFGATLMVAGNIPGRTDTMPLAIYGYTATGDWKSAHIMVIILTLISGIFLYTANRFSKRNF
ncbi:MAG: molybdate ABC transporter permease subunit [Rhizobacter sp.]|nr:molybdate ABC transporter permease subunit [Bacteriovorax sp.]